MIETYQPSVVLIDLMPPVYWSLLLLLMTYQQIAAPGTWFVAFGPHVDVESLNSARAAGCHVVLARSHFAAQLPDLLRQYFTQPGKLMKAKDRSRLSKLILLTIDPVDQTELGDRPRAWRVGFSSIGAA